MRTNPSRRRSRTAGNELCTRSSHDGPISRVRAVGVSRTPTTSPTSTSTLVARTSSSSGIQTCTPRDEGTRQPTGLPVQQIHQHPVRRLLTRQRPQVQQHHRRGTLRPRAERRDWTCLRVRRHAALCLDASRLRSARLRQERSRRYEVSRLLPHGEDRADACCRDGRRP